MYALPHPEKIFLCPALPEAKKGCPVHSFVSGMHGAGMDFRGDDEQHHVIVQMNGPSE